MTQTAASLSQLWEAVQGVGWRVFAVWLLVCFLEFLLVHVGV